MLDVSTVGTDLTPEQQDETISDLAFFLDEFGSTSAVRIKLQEQESDIKRLKKQLESLKNGNSDDEEGEEDFFYAEDNEQTMGDVDDTMVDLQFFLQTYGSTRAVREKLERQRHKIMRLQRTARRIQERRQSEAVSDTSSDEEFSRIGPTPTSTKEEGDIEVALQQYESQTQPGDDDGNGPRVEKNCSDDCSTMDKATDADMRDPALQSAFQAQPLHPESAPTLGEISYRGLKTALNCGIGGLEELVELDHNKATNSNSCNDDGYALDGYALDASREDDASATASETNSDDDTSMIGRQPENENHATGEPGVNIDASAEVSMRSADVLMAPTVCGGDECVDEEKDGCHLRAASLTNLTSNEIPNYIELVAKALRHASELCAESKASSVSSESKDTELSGEENFSENPSVDATETNSINDSDDAVSEFEEDPAFGCRSKRFCRYPNCNNWSKVNGLCRRHGGYRICTADGCDQKAITRNLCRFHGGGTKCKVDECEKFAKYKGYCRRHGRELVVDTRKSCRFQGCNKLGMEEGYCRDHQVTSTGGVENAILSVQAGPSIEKHEVVSRKRGGNESKPAFTLKRAGHKNCKVPRCNKWAMPSGYCSKHQDLPLNKEKLAQPK